MKLKKILGLMMSIFVFVNGFSQDLSELYEKVNGAVVTIHSTSKEGAVQGSRIGTVTVQGLGSGFMISDKRVITAAHVIQASESITVEFPDGERISANVVSSYRNADVALLELAYAKKNAVTVKLGDSNETKVGERIFVIGAPFGIQHSLSSGYISGRIGGDMKMSSAFTDIEYFQTDASINTGNSGGPMFNLEGEVIGIVSYILSQSGGFEGLGFAATSNVAKDLLIERSPFYLGVDGQMVGKSLAGLLNLPQPQGYLVQKVAFLSPAGMMGIKGGAIKAQFEGEEILLGGDIILSFNGLELNFRNIEDLSDHFSLIKKGDQIVVKVLRAGKVIELTGQY